MWIKKLWNKKIKIWKMGKYIKPPLRAGAHFRFRGLPFWHQNMYQFMNRIWKNCEDLTKWEWKMVEDDWVDDGKRNWRRRIILWWMWERGFFFFLRTNEVLIGVAIQLLQLPSVIYIFLKRKIYWRVGTKNLGSNSL